MLDEAPRRRLRDDREEQREHQLAHRALVMVR